MQSTLILSRKDGSIIQSTGQLAQTEENGTSRTAQTTPTDSNSVPPASDSTPASPALSPPYQPSQAETLAAHIFAFVSSASALGISLSRPTPSVPRTNGSHWEESYENGNEGAAREERDDSLDRDEDGEVKLLRMRTKKHEIVVVPDRKYLLCVVHDASPGGGPGAAGSRR